MNEVWLVRVLHCLSCMNYNHISLSVVSNYVYSDTYYYVTNYPESSGWLSIIILLSFMVSVGQTLGRALLSSSGSGSLMRLQSR